MSLEGDISISKVDLLDLIHWARRYCDKEGGVSAKRFNGVYRRIRSDAQDLLRSFDCLDPILKDRGINWPLANE